MNASLFPLLILCAGWATLPAQAQQAPADPAISVEFSREHQRLSNGSPDWNEHTLRLARSRKREMNAEFSWTSARRFGLQNEQFAAQYGQAIDAKLYATLGASFSPEHQFLPQRSLEGMLQYQFAPAWLVHGGWKSMRYDAATVEQGTLALEQYIAAFSWALAWRPVWTLGAQTATSELRLSYYPGEKNSVTLSLSSGRVPIATATTLLLVDGQAAALTGRYWFTHRWSASYALSSTQVGNYYTSTGIRAGVQYVF